MFDTNVFVLAVFDIRGRYGTFGKVDAITVTKKKVETQSYGDYM